MKWYVWLIIIIGLVLIVYFISRPKKTEPPPPDKSSATLYDVILGGIGLGGNIWDDIFGGKQEDKTNNETKS